tara:strand:+ start:4333 stop:5016 length:684 start_codon:yes stop_codon:yes gene_type:complete
MNKFEDVLKSSVNGSYCVYIIFIADVPANLLTWLLSSLKSISANFISFLSLCFIASASLFVISEDLFLSSILFYIGFILDFVDGKVARLKKTSSFYGKKIDIFVDRIGFTIMVLSYLYYLQTNQFFLEISILLLYSFLFYLFDIFQLTDEILKMKSKNYLKENYQNYSPDKYLDILSKTRKWFPSRLLTIVFLFSLAPITNFFSVYLFCLIILFARFLRVLKYFFSI